MSDGHTCRYGRSHRTTPVKTYEQLLDLSNREGADDGAIIFTATLEDCGGEPLCGDCKIGHLKWAEGGYVPWHRICDVCGSHWDLHPITWGPVTATKEMLDQIAIRQAEKCATCLEFCETCEYEGRQNCPVHHGHSHHVHYDFVRFVDGAGYVPLNSTESIGESGKTWGDLLALATAELWKAASEPERVQRMAGMAVIGGAWAIRARFY